jgi:hypothetical protein
VLLLGGSCVERMALLVIQLLFVQLWVLCRCVASLHELIRAGRVNREYAVDSKPQTLNLKSKTLDSEPSTLNLKP